MRIMDTDLQLPVSYNGETLEFPFRVAHVGYIRRFVVIVHGVEVHFETDDSGELRAIVPNINDVNIPLPKQSLLEAIGASIRQLLD